MARPGVSIKHDHDVIILGSGLGGTMLGSILARHGRRVLILEAGRHPRFAIGEATTPDTSFRLKLLSKKYDVPEISYISEFYLLRDHIGPSSGVKRGFSFLYHQPQQDQQPRRSHQFPTGAPPWGPDCHLFRQDTDAFMLSVAVRYGAQVRQSTPVESVEFSDDGVTAVSAKGERFTAAFVVDAAGYRSPVARQLGLRGDQAQMRTNSRAIFTHMIGVHPYERVGEAPSQYGLVYPLSQTTLHHVFDGGWLYVIHFDNHDKPVNRLCSVGMLLDRGVHPESGRDPEQEFFEIIGRYPGIARQFTEARAVRDWVSTGRIQYWSPVTVGDRWLLLAHAASFADPLYSPGLNLTVGVLDLFADELLAALRDGDFNAGRFEAVDAFFGQNTRFYDRFIANTYLSWRDYDLWDAWYRVWVAGLQVATYVNGTLLMRFLSTGDRSVLEHVPGSPVSLRLGNSLPECRRLFDDATEQIERFGRGELTAAAAAANIREALRAVNFCPSYWRLPDPDARITPPYTMTEMVRAYVWYHRHAPAHIRDLMVGFSPWTAVRHTLDAFRDSGRRDLGGGMLYLRDSLMAWNRR